jgi:hypothetical protein
MSARAPEERDVGVLATAEEMAASLFKLAKSNIERDGWLLPVMFLGCTADPQTGAPFGRTEMAILTPQQVGLTQFDYDSKTKYFEVIRQLVERAKVLTVISITESWVVRPEVARESEALRAWLQMYGSLANYPGRTEEMSILLQHASRPGKGRAWSAPLIRDGEKLTVGAMNSDPVWFDLEGRTAFFPAPPAAKPDLPS